MNSSFTGDDDDTTLFPLLFSYMNHNAVLINDEFIEEIISNISSFTYMKH